MFFYAPTPEMMAERVQQLDTLLRSNGVEPDAETCVALMQLAARYLGVIAQPALLDDAGETLRELLQVVTPVLLGELVGQGVGGESEAL